RFYPDERRQRRSAGENAGGVKLAKENRVETSSHTPRPKIADRSSLTDLVTSSRRFDARNALSDCLGESFCARVVERRIQCLQRRLGDTSHLAKGLSSVSAGGALTADYQLGQRPDRMFGGDWADEAKRLRRVGFHIRVFVVQSSDQSGNRRDRRFTQV